MMTPQEVASHAFAKATLGGYNMAMVDEFLDALTEDYTALYNDNAILKNKLKVLSDTVEEYRATDVAMRKTLLAAQQMAESMVAEAEAKKNSLVHDAESAAADRIEDLRRQIAAEEFRLAKAQEQTAAYVEKLRAAHNSEMAFLDGLAALVPPSAAPVKDDPAVAIQASLSGLAGEEAAPAAAEEEAPVEEPARPVYEDLDADATRRFEDLQFSKDYRIE